MKNKKQKFKIGDLVRVKKLLSNGYQIDEFLGIVINSDLGWGCPWFVHMTNGERLWVAEEDLKKATE